MKKIRCYIVEFYRLATLLALGFAAWKIIRHWHAGLAEKTGHAIDVSVNSAAEKLEKTAVKLEQWAASGLGENLGKGLDEILTDTKNTLDKASDLVQRALHHTKKQV